MSARRFIHPEGLPSDYTITLLFRLLPDTPQEPFALWEILDKDGEPLVGVILDSESAQITSSTLLHPRSQLVCVCSCRWRKNADVLQQQLQGRVPDGHLRRARDPQTLPRQLPQGQT